MGAALARRGTKTRAAVERVPPTPETAAKLESDPLQALLAQGGKADAELERAADEIRAVYLAVIQGLLRGRMREDDTSAGRPDMRDRLACAHAGTYLPWARATHPAALALVIDLVVDRREINQMGGRIIVGALREYARRMGARSCQHGLGCAGLGCGYS